MVCTSEFNARKKTKKRSTKKRSTTKRRAKPVSNALVLRKLNTLLSKKKRAAPKRRRRRRVASGGTYYSAGPSYTNYDADYINPPGPNGTLEYVNAYNQRRYAVNTGNRVYRDVRSCHPSNTSHKLCLNSERKLALNPYSAAGRHAALYASLPRNPMDRMIQKMTDDQYFTDQAAIRAAENNEFRRQTMASMQAAYKPTVPTNVVPGQSGFMSRITPQWRMAPRFSLGGGGNFGGSVSGIGSVGGGANFGLRG